MDSTKPPLPYSDRSDHEPDLSLLLYKLGKTVKNGLVAIGKIFMSFRRQLLLLTLFLTRNILWILLGAAIGLGYAVYNLSSNGSKYYSEMTVRTNFSSVRSLYNSIDYFNTLINNNKKDDLAKIFNIQPDEATQLVNFSIKPVKSEIITAQLYKEEFLLNDRTSKVRQDTFWTRVLKYPDFKKALTDYDYPNHTLSVVARSPMIFNKLEAGISRQVSNKLVENLKTQKILVNKNDERILDQALQNIDTLSKALSQRLQNGSTAGATGNQVNMLQSPNEQKFLELELFSSMLDMQAELKKTRLQSAMENDIIEVLAPFNPIGQKISFISIITDWTLKGLIFASLILTAIWLYRSLADFEASNRGKMNPTTPPAA